MKHTKLFFTTALTALLGVGALVGAQSLKSEKAAVKAEAATNSVTLASSVNGWSTTADPLTLDGDYWTIEKTFDANDTFKIVVNGSDWVGDGDGVTWCSGMGSEGKGQNFKVLTAGSYLIKAAKTIGDYGDKSYGIVFENVVTKYTVTKYKVLDGASPVSIGSEQVNAGTSYAVPANRYEAGYTFGGWYKEAACTNKYTARAINANTNIYAKYTSGTWSGSVTIDLGNSGWSEAAANYAVLFMDKTTYPSEISQWSTYLTGTAANAFQISVSYNIGFEPKTMLVARYDASYSQASWNTEKWPTDGSLWGQTPDIEFGTHVIVSNSDEANKPASVYYPVVKGGLSEWTDKAVLTTSKLNGSGHVEYYSTSVTFAKDETFKLVVPSSNGDIYYNSYSTHSSLESSFALQDDGDHNIICKAAGTYAFYFDSATRSVYITKVEIAEADEWAQYFLGHVGCDSTGKNEPTGWSDCATEYGKLSGAAKNIIYAAAAKADGNYVEQAVARYDLAIKNHPSLTKFIVNSSDVVRASAVSVDVLESDIESNEMLVVVVASAISLSMLSCVLLALKKKRRQQ